METQFKQNLIDAIIESMAGVKCADWNITLDWTSRYQHIPTETVIEVGPKDKLYLEGYEVEDENQRIALKQAIADMIHRKNIAHKELTLSVLYHRFGVPENSQMFPKENT
jgi:hypothetical protein